MSLLFTRESTRAMIPARRPEWLVLIVNPTSNNGRCGRTLHSVLSRLQDAGIDTRTQMSRSLEHARELAASADSVLVVAMGGDGIVSAVAGEISNRNGVAMGIVPAGRGNDFARSLGISGLETAVATLINGDRRQIDVGMVNGKAFVGSASVGLDSRVMQIVSRTRLLKGSNVYRYAVLRALVDWHPVGFRLKLDGVESSFDGHSVVVANGNYYGGGMRIAPDASLSDGLFDVVTISDASRLQLLGQTRALHRGTHVNHPAVNVTRAATVEVECDKKYSIIADGEEVGPPPMLAAMRAGTLTVIAPSSSR